MSAVARIVGEGARPRWPDGSSRRPRRSSPCCSGRATAARSTCPELADGRVRPPAERRADDRARRARPPRDRTSVDRRHRDARRHRGHVDRQLRRRGSRRLLGARWPATRRPRWSPSSSTASSGSTSCSIALALIAALVWRWRRSGCGWACRSGRRVARVARARSALPRPLSCAPAASPRPSWDFSENRAQLVFAARTKTALARIRHAAAHEAPPRAGGSAPRRSRAPRDSKLRRVLPGVAGALRVGDDRSGCSSRPTPHYGEIWYELGGRTVMSRSDDGGRRAGNDLRVRRRDAGGRDARTTSFADIRSPCSRSGAAAVFYGIWPAQSVAGAVTHSEEEVDERVRSGRAVDRPSRR